MLIMLLAAVTGFHGFFQAITLVIPQDLSGSTMPQSLRAAKLPSPSQSLECKLHYVRKIYFCVR